MVDCVVVLYDYVNKYHKGIFSFQFQLLILLSVVHTVCTTRGVLATMICVGNSGVMCLQTFRRWQVLCLWVYGVVWTAEMCVLRCCENSYIIEK
jgi:hypothetical protein